MARNTVEEGPHPLDIAMGMRVRLRRKEIGMSQTDLADAVGITFQQIQKYEHGTNRLSFSRLIEICGALKCNLADLMADLDVTRARGALARQAARLAEPGANDLLSAYASITSIKQRRAILDLARQLASDETAQGRRGQ